MNKSCRLMFLFSFIVALVSAQTPALKTIATVPQGFEPNRGQADPAVEFTSHGPGYTLSLTARSADLQLVSPATAKQFTALRLGLVGSVQQARGEGVERQAGKSNYFLGNDSNQWLTDIPQYGRVEYHGVYPGIDVAYYGNNQQLEYDFIVGPHADPRRIRIAVDGADRIQVDPAGELVLTVGSAEIRERKPVIYQETRNGRRVVEGHYVALDGNQVGFELGRYDLNTPLVIDPVLVFSTFFGKAGAEQGTAVSVDSVGNVYMCGSVGTGAFGGTVIGTPVFAGANLTAFVVKISPSGALISSTFIGGTNDQAVCNAIALDVNGNIYLAGNNTSASFPTVNAIQSSAGGAGDGFALELNNAGNSLIYSTYLGGNASDNADGIAVDLNGNTLVSGSTHSPNFRVLNATQSTLNGSSNAFAVKIAPGGSSLVYSTYFGGSGSDLNAGLVVDNLGDLAFYGSTSSTNFPVLHAFQPNFCGWVQGQNVSNSHGYVAMLGPGGAPIYSTYICGSAAGDVVRGAAIDAAGNLLLTGNTASLTFPTLNPIQASFGGGTGDAFISKLSPAGTLLFSTYLGGAGADQARGIATDQLDNIYVAGYTTSTNFPTVNATQRTPGGADDAFLTKINVGSAIVFSTYIGGAGEDYGFGLAVDGLANAYIAGKTASANFPTLSPLQPTYGGGASDAFLTAISTCDFTFSSSAAFGVGGGTGNTSITTTPECGWSATSNSSWITVTSSPATGAGSGSVSWSVDPNSGGARQGSLTIAGHTVSITQNGVLTLSVTETNGANFIQGEAGATYTVIVSNGPGAGSTTGTVTLTQTLPTGLTLVSMAGNGWGCTGAVCTRSDALAAGASYPAVTVTVNVAANAGTPLAAQVSVSGGGSSSTATATDNTTIAPANTPVLSVTETNAASFSQGQSGATYTVNVANGAAAGPTTGTTVTLTQTLPTGLTLVSMAGNGWGCTGAVCTRSDVLAPGVAYPQVMVTVNVAANAPASVTSQVSVAGGGSATATGSDVTTITSVTPSALTVTETNSAPFSQGQSGAVYTVTVGNGAGAGGPTTGTVTLTQTLPAGLTLVSMAGNGWSCTGGVCTRSDALAPGAQYPPVTATVNVAANAAVSVTSQVSVSGGGSATAAGSDVTTIQPVNVLTLTNQGANNMSFSGLLIDGVSGTQTNNCPNIFNVNVTCTFTLTFTGGAPVINVSTDWAQFSTFAAADQQLIQGPPNPTRLVFMGDSVTQFWDSPSPYGEGSLSSVKAFVNRGISGQTLEQMLVRFREDVVKLQPAVVHILGGTNDLGANSGPETNAQILDQIQSMAEVAKANGIKVLIASITPVIDLPGGNIWTVRRPNATIVALNQLIQAYCQQVGAIYVDYYSVLVDGNGNMNANLTVDGLHPNTAGFQAMVPVALAALQQAGY